MSEDAVARPPGMLPTVLIVDDERVNRVALAELLKDECRIVLAKDGPSALERVAQERDLHLVLLDVSMPGMDGYEVLRQLRSKPETASIAVIFVTGQNEEEDEEKGLNLGAADYLPKPIRPAIVRARVRNHLRLVQQRNELERLSHQDSLTGIANRRRFDEVYERAFRHGVRIGAPLGVAMIDIDHFKQYNDRYGHGAGDDALWRVAQSLAGCAVRPHDLVARYGGEEFVLLVADASSLEAVLERMRQQVAALGIVHATSPVAEVLTISCGGVIAEPALAASPKALLQLADEALYQAKRLGRNRVAMTAAGPGRRTGT